MLLSNSQPNNANYCILFSSEDAILLVTSSDVSIVANGKTYTPGLFIDTLLLTSLQNTSSDVVAQIAQTAIIDVNSILNKRVTISLYNQNSNKNLPLYRGYITSVQNEGSNTFNVNIVSIVNKLSIQVGNFFSPICRANLGDNSCKKDMDTLKIEGCVTAIYSVLSFSGNHQQKMTDYFKFGKIIFTTGANAGIAYQLQNDVNGTIFLSTTPKQLIVVNDKYEIYPGCDKSFNTCKAKFNNMINFQGEPFINKG